MSFGACFHDYILKSGYEKVLCNDIGCEAQTHQKRYELISIHQEASLLFWYKIIIHSDEAKDSSVSSGACFHDFL